MAGSEGAGRDCGVEDGEAGCLTGLNESRIVAEHDIGRHP